MNLSNLTKYTLADLMAWVGYHRGNGRWADGLEAGCVARMIEKFLEEQEDKVNYGWCGWCEGLGCAKCHGKGHYET